jgi:hypothetical protein
MILSVCVLGIKARALAGGVAQVVEQLPSKYEKYEACSLKPSA